MPSALGPAALGLLAYISGKALVPVLQLLHIASYFAVELMKRWDLETMIVMKLITFFYGSYSSSGTIREACILYL